MSTCPICNRELGEESDEHHLIPRLKKGTETVRMHIICHRKIHSLFSESELASWYNTVERLMEHPDMQKFAKWVAKKPIDYIDSSKRANRHPRGKRR